MNDKKVIDEEEIWEEVEDGLNIRPLPFPKEIIIKYPDDRNVSDEVPKP